MRINELASSDYKFQRAVVTITLSMLNQFSPDKFIVIRTIKDLLQPFCSVISMSECKTFMEDCIANYRLVAHMIVQKIGDNEYIVWDYSEYCSLDKYLSGCDPEYAEKLKQAIESFDR